MFSSSRESARKRNNKITKVGRQKVKFIRRSTCKYSSFPFLDTKKPCKLLTCRAFKWLREQDLNL